MSTFVFVVLILIFRKPLLAAICGFARWFFEP